MSGTASRSGSSQGSALLAMYPSDSTITGVMYFRARRTASIIVPKASAGEAMASTGSGASPWRPYIAMSRSACSVLVGMPVEGPARCTSTMISGSSVMTARLIVSDFRAMPGPLVPVTPRLPAKEAPRAMPMAAISSSAWKVRTPSCW